jgi:hypothetical protein
MTHPSLANDSLRMTGFFCLPCTFSVADIITPESALLDQRPADQVTLMRVRRTARSSSVGASITAPAASA